MYLALIRKTWNTRYDYYVKVNIAVDAVALNAHPYTDKYGVRRNEIKRINLDNTVEYLPIKYGFAYYICPLNPHFKSKLLFFQVSDKGNAGQK